MNGGGKSTQRRLFITLVVVVVIGLLSLLFVRQDAPKVVYPSAVQALGESPITAAYSRIDPPTPTLQVQDSRDTHGAFDDLVPPQQVGELRMLVGADAWRNVGHGSPAKALQTFYWAMKGGDIDTVERTITLDASARKQMADMWESLPAAEKARFDRPEQLAAFLMCGTSDVRGYLFTREERTEDKSIVTVLTSHPDGSGKLRGSRMTVMLHRDGLWRVIVTRRELSKYQVMAGLPVR
jgi:hypothetical protein